MRLCLFRTVGALLIVLSIVACNKSEAPSNSLGKDATPKAATSIAKETPTMDFSAAATPPEKEATKPKDSPTNADAPSASPATDEKVETGASPVDGNAVPELGSPFLLKREGLRIETVTLSKGFEKSEDGSRVPVEPGYSFPCDDRRIYVIVDLVNPNETEGELKVGWIKPDGVKEGNTVTMSVTPKKNWRTFAFNGFTNNLPGRWQVVIRDTDDTVLARTSFEMKSN